MADQEKRNVEVRVAVLVLNGDRILLEKRAHTLGGGTWAPPVGHLDFGEYPEQTAMRETQEETGIVIADPKFRVLTNDGGSFVLAVNAMAFDFRALPFVNVAELFSAIPVPVPRILGEAADRMLAWLESDLSSTGQFWKIVFLHHPPYPTGHHAADVSCAAVRALPCEATTDPI